jgi:hypothetical protein
VRKAGEEMRVEDYLAYEYPGGLLLSAGARQNDTTLPNPPLRLLPIHFVLRDLRLRREDEATTIVVRT